MEMRLLAHMTAYRRPTRAEATDVPKAIQLYLRLDLKLHRSLERKHGCNRRPNREKKRCSSMGIPFTGTVGILKVSLMNGHLSLILADEILHKMIEAGSYSPIRTFADIA
jgi:hypothetical protein